ncbi:CoA transferase [Polynucleobacter sp. TSB-Sco08W16]|uniref:CaiB/BaiF CoA transferase family protein n=1 Tax=Polynucleobacter sp. TSB-Sco08W16 TaxID=1758374 RepID=UPI001BFE5CDF|nr:CoA transferase [Polynucleobacter sp. TSB-Sco08W16]QWD73486.1 CoA transferase [Polynucleobacter sp. TSB-Sco08W16]
MSAENIKTAKAQSNADALAGLKILDLSRVLAGPWCGQLLGDLGAEVIKVESLNSGDDTRAWGPPFLEGESAYFLGCNRNKRGITIDFSSADGKSLLAQLIPKFDVVLENFKTGTLEKWGFNQAWFETHAPMVVRCSITGYGSEGPQAGLPGYDFILQAESGLMSISGSENGEPSKYGVAIVDLATGMMAANAIQAALLARYRTGKGQLVEVSLFDTATALLANVGNSHLATGKDSGRYGNGHPTIVPYTTYRCSDGMIALAVGNDGQFAKLAAYLGNPEWANDERFKTNAARVNNRAVLDEHIKNKISRYSSNELINELRKLGIPIGNVNTVKQALASQQTQAKNMVLNVQHQKIGSFKTLGTPLRMHGTPSSIRYAPPLLGEHTDEILSEYLNLNTEDLSELKNKKVIA